MLLKTFIVKCHPQIYQQRFETYTVQKLDIYTNVQSIYTTQCMLTTALKLVSWIKPPGLGIACGSIQFRRNNRNIMSFHGWITYAQRLPMNTNEDCECDCHWRRHDLSTVCHTAKSFVSKQVYHPDSRHDKPPPIAMYNIAESASVTFRCKSVRHLGFTKFEVFDVRESLRSDFASSYKVSHKLDKSLWNYCQNCIF